MDADELKLKLHNTRKENAALRLEHAKLAKLVMVLTAQNKILKTKDESWGTARLAKGFLSA